MRGRFVVRTWALTLGVGWWACAKAGALMAK